MSRILLKTLLVTAVIASVAGAASAAPVSSIAVIHGPAYPAPTRSLVQPVHWEHHHGHRVWVSDHHRYHH